MQKLNSFTSIGYWLALVFAGCAGGETHFAICDGGIETVSDGTLYCGFPKEAIVSDFKCPEAAPIRVDVGDAIVCSSKPVDDPSQLPQEVCDKIQQVCVTKNPNVIPDPVEVINAPLELADRPAMLSRLSNAYCNRATRCPGHSEGGEVDNCDDAHRAQREAAWADYMPVVKGSFWDPFISCLETQCTGDDFCIEQSVIANTPSLDPWNSPRYAEFGSKQTMCLGMPHDDYAGLMLAATDDAFAQLSACYLQPCGDIEVCLNAHIDAGRFDGASQLPTVAILRVDQVYPGTVVTPIGASQGNGAVLSLLYDNDTSTGYVFDRTNQAIGSLGLLFGTVPASSAVEFNPATSVWRPNDQVDIRGVKVAVDWSRSLTQSAFIEMRGRRYGDNQLGVGFGTTPVDASNASWLLMPSTQKSVQRLSLEIMSDVADPVHIAIMEITPSGTRRVYFPLRPR